jgi:hypothetical protein
MSVAKLSQYPRIPLLFRPDGFFGKKIKKAEI